MKPLIFILFSAISSFFVNAQSYISLGLDNSFDVAKLYRGDTEAILETGFLSNSVYLKGNTDYLDITNELNLYEPFTMCFWFKPQSFSNNGSLIRQDRFIKDKDQIATSIRFIDLLLESKELYLITEKKLRYKLASLDESMSKQGWFFIAFSGDSRGFKVSLQGQEVFVGQDGTMFHRIGECTDQIVIGEGTGHFTGWIDELSIFDEILNKQSLIDLMDKQLSSAIGEPKSKTVSISEPVVDGDINVEANPEKIIPPVDKNSSDLNEYLKGRKNVIKEEVKITDKEIEVDIWDYYKKPDGDKVSVFLNNESTVPESRNKVPLKRFWKKKRIYLNLKNERENYLVFFAENTGDYHSESTVAVKIKGIKEVFEFNATEKVNPVIKIVDETKPEIPLSDLPLKALPEIISNSDNLIIQLSNESESDPSDFLNVTKSPDKTHYSIFLRTAPELIHVKLKPNEKKIFTIQATKLGNDNKCTAMLKVLKGDTPLLEKELLLHENSYEIPIRFHLDQVQSGERHIEIAESSANVKEIFIELSDHKDIDGDRITLLYNDKVIVGNHQLRKNPLTKKIVLDQNSTDHIFLVKSTDFGSSIEHINTPLVRILANEKEIDKFVLWIEEGKNDESAIIKISTQ